MKKMRYQVIQGHHSHEGRVYSRGDVITTSIDLDKRFRNKFNRLESRRTIRPDDIDEDIEVIDSEPVNLKVKHKGRGKYDVVNKDTGEPVNDKPLSKDEAFAIVGK